MRSGHHGDGEPHCGYHLDGSDRAKDERRSDVDVEVGDDPKSREEHGR